MIFIALLLFYLFLAISFSIKNKALGMISCFGLMTVSVYILINGISFLNNLLTITLSSISFGFGSYTLISGYLSEVS